MEKLAVLHKELVISVIKKLSNMIYELEAKRGIGIDKRLRYLSTVYLVIFLHWVLPLIEYSGLWLFT